MFPVDNETQNLITREHTERLREAMARPARDVGLRRDRRDDDQSSRPLLARALRARASDSTRRFGNGVLRCVLGSGETTAACQLPDGALVLRAETDAESRAPLRARRGGRPLEFLERFRDDELLAGPIRHLKGMRPLRTATVTARCCAPSSAS